MDRFRMSYRIGIKFSWSILLGTVAAASGCTLSRPPETAAVAPETLAPQPAPLQVPESFSPPSRSHVPARTVSRETVVPGGPESAPRLPSEPAEPARVVSKPVSVATGGTVHHASQSTFEQQVLKSEVPVLVDFYATWCGPCRTLAPTLAELAAETPQAKVVKVDIDASPDLAARYGVASVPNLMVFKDGRVVAKQTGVVSKPRMKALLGL